MAVPLIGEGRTTSEDPDLASLSDEERDRLAAMAHPEDVDDFIPVTTAFLVIVDKDGSVVASPDVTAKVAPDRVATADDVIAFGTLAVADAQAFKTAQATAFQMAQVGQLMAQQREQQLIQQRIAQDKGFKNL